MKLSSLLAQRQSLLKQARLANLAYAHDRLGDFAARIARARLTGEVRLQQADPDHERYWAALTPLQGSQAVIEEHFTEDNLMDLADIIAYLTGVTDLDLTFRLEDLADRFLAPLRDRLEEAGVTFDQPASRNEAATHDGTADCSHVDGDA